MLSLFLFNCSLLLIESDGQLGDEPTLSITRIRDNWIMLPNDCAVEKDGNHQKEPHMNILSISQEGHPHEGGNQANERRMHHDHHTPINTRFKETIDNILHNAGTGSGIF